MLAFPYRYEDYSVFDIIQFLSKQGCQTKKVDLNQNDRLVVDNTSVYIDFPSIDINGLVLASIRINGTCSNENYQDSKKIYDKLKRKFCRSRKESWDQKDIDKIKDLDKMKIIDWRKDGKRIKGESLKRGWKFLRQKSWHWMQKVD